MKLHHNFLIQNILVLMRFIQPKIRFNQLPWKILPLLILLFSDSLNGQTINQFDVLITEVMFDPIPEVGLPNDEYIEIFNNSNRSISLSELQICVGKKQITPQAYDLPPDSFYVFWDPIIPALKNSGDSIRILHKNSLIHRLDYKPSMHLSTFKSNGGWSIELVDFTKPCLTSGNWLSSEHDSGGTPGFTNSMAFELSVPQVKVDSYFPISDTTLLVNFNVPLTPYASDNIYPIDKLDSSSLDSLSIHSIKTCFKSNFNPQTLIYGLPHIPDSGDLVINEILFNPDEYGHDFIEVYNTSEHSFDLSKLYFSSKDVNGALEKPFVLSTSPRLILPRSYQVFCKNISWLSAVFPHSKNHIQTNLPAMNNAGGSVLIVNQSGKVMDELHYREDWHYKELIDNENVSLEKIIPTHSNVPSNWTSCSSTENYATPGYENTNLQAALKPVSNFKLAYEIITPNSDGYQDQLILHYRFNTTGWTGQIDVLNYSGVTIHSLTPNTLFGQNGSISWDGFFDDQTKIPPGIYALWINAYHYQNQESKRKKIVFYINGTL